MRTEIYIENNQIDVGKDEASLLTFAIAELQDFGSRQTTFSKTIVLPGTSTNNKLFGAIFDIGNSNEYNPLLDNIGYNFNASKSADCIIFQDNLQTFKGGLRLLQINIDRGRVEYEVAVFGTLATLNVSLTSGKLEDLDFSAYDQVYNDTNIVASWSASPGSGVLFPLIDYGTYSSLKHDWDIRTFRPALYAKEYIDKMFAAAGFRYDCSLFNTSRFKGLIVPHNQKELTGLNSVVATGLVSSPHTYDFSVLLSYNLMLDSFGGTDFSYSLGTIEYTGASPITLDINIIMFGNYTSINDIIISLQQNGVDIATQLLPMGGGVANISLISTATAISPGDLFVIKLVDQSTTLGPPDSLTINTASVVYSVQSGTATVIINPGDTIQTNKTIPKNIRQIDFFLSILQLFNMYAYEDKFDDRLINIKPYIDFYSTDSSNSVDWTYKLDRDSVRHIKPMSELNSKIYNFNYKTDGDYYNDLYNKRYSQVYGGYIYDSQFEFTAEENTLELVFSPTVLVGYDSEDKVYSTIFKRTGDDTSPVEETVDCNIRLLQSKLITGVSSWDILNGATVLASETDYMYAGHLNDPDAPSDDINFGVLQQLFFTLATGNLSATQFNIYWSPYMAEITDKDSKLLVAKFHLTPADIFNLDFSKYIVVDGSLFRLNKIIDYNVNEPSTCEVELLRVINTIY